MPCPWTRRERERAATGLMARAFIDIRTIAYMPELAGDPTSALERIRMIADACHNLPGSTRRNRQDNGPDPFVRTWQTASSDQREWLAQVLLSLALDSAWLDNAPTRHSLSQHSSALLDRNKSVSALTWLEPRRVA